MEAFPWIKLTYGYVSPRIGDSVSGLSDSGAEGSSCDYDYGYVSSGTADSCSDCRILVLHS